MDLILPKIGIQLLYENSKIPVKSDDSDFCYDCYAVSRQEILPGVYQYGLGFRYEIFDVPEHIRVGFTVRPRSSIFKTGLVLCNAPGTCDQRYRGEVKVNFYHVMKDFPIYEVGERVCQINFDVTQVVQFILMKEISTDTTRGEGGFGHTGNK